MNFNNCCVYFISFTVIIGNIFIIIWGKQIFNEYYYLMCIFSILGIIFAIFFGFKK
jgi:hypothetical protein